MDSGVKFDNEKLLRQLIDVVNLCDDVLREAVPLRTKLKGPGQQALEDLQSARAHLHEEIGIAAVVGLGRRDS